MADLTLRTNRTATLEVISPLHIGSGSGPMLADYDFATERGVVWVMDQRKLLDRYYEEELRHGVPEVRISRRLRPEEYPACAAYSLAAPGDVGNQILPCIKDAHLRPYVPGSSIKGAVRTVIAWAMASRGGRAPVSSELGDHRTRAGARWERRAFGRSPNYDLMRALLVDDTEPVEADRIELVSVSVYSLRGSGLAPKGGEYRFSVEALKPGTRLACRIGVAADLFSRDSLGMADGRRWIDGLDRLARERAADLIEGERAFYARTGPRPLLQFYDRLGSRLAGLGAGQFLLWMSWGTGWAAKTLGAVVSGAEWFPRALDRYGLGSRDAPFPKSRRLVERGGVASEPLGWVEVTL